MLRRFKAEEFSNFMLAITAGETCILMSILIDFDGFRMRKGHGTGSWWPFLAPNKPFLGHLSFPGLFAKAGATAVRLAKSLKPKHIASTLSALTCAGGV